MFFENVCNKSFWKYGIYYIWHFPVLYCIHLHFYSDLNSLTTRRFMTHHLQHRIMIGYLSTFFSRRSKLVTSSFVLPSTTSTLLVTSITYCEPSYTAVMACRPCKLVSSGVERVWIFSGHTYHGGGGVQGPPYSMDEMWIYKAIDCGCGGMCVT